MLEEDYKEEDYNALAVALRDKQRKHAYPTLPLDSTSFFIKDYIASKDKMQTIAGSRALQGAVQMLGKTAVATISHHVCGSILMGHSRSSTTVISPRQVVLKQIQADV